MVVIGGNREAEHVFARRPFSHENQGLLHSFIYKCPFVKVLFSHIANVDAGRDTNI